MSLLLSWPRAGPVRRHAAERQAPWFRRKQAIHILHLESGANAALISRTRHLFYMARNIRPVTRVLQWCNISHLPCKPPDKPFMKSFSSQTAQDDDDYNDWYPGTEMNKFRLALKKDGNPTWGFIIYRCTYESDADWIRFMKIVNDSIEIPLREYYYMPHLLETLDWNVQEDRVGLNGASTEVVRTRFQKWSERELAKLDQYDPLQYKPRFNYCVHVDEAVVDYKPPEAKYFIDTEGQPEFNNGYVNLVKLDWDLETAKCDDEEAEWDGDPPYDVGYCRVPVSSVGLSLYPQFYIYYDDWDLMYRPPPEYADF